MVKLFDRVKVNIATTGVGDVTFGSAASAAFLTPTEAGCLDADEVRYVIVDGTDYEEGVGTIKSSVAEMERTTVTKSKISGTAGTTKINLSGTAVLAFIVSAADIMTPWDNLGSVDDADVALDNLGLTTIGKGVATAANIGLAQAAIGATLTGRLLFTAADAASARKTVTGSVLAKTANYTATSDDDGCVIAADATSGGITVSLPAAASNSNMRLIVKKSDSSANTVTIDPNSSELIEGAATLVLRLQGQSVALVCDGSSWAVLSDTAVFERGSNANGDYIRYANGIQECWQVANSSFTTGTLSVTVYIASIATFTFSKPFVSAPLVTPIADKASAGSGVVWAVLPNSTPTTTTVGVLLIGETSTASAKPAYRAIGKWF